MKNKNKISSNGLSLLPVEARIFFGGGLSKGFTIFSLPRLPCLDKVPSFFSLLALYKKQPEC